MASPPPKTLDRLSDKEASFKAEDTVPVYNAHVDVSQVDERKLMRKIDMTLIPWLSLLYLLSFLDRTSIGKYVIYQHFLICRLG